MRIGSQTQNINVQQKILPKVGILYNLLIFESIFSLHVWNCECSLNGLDRLEHALHMQ